MLNFNKVNNSNVTDCLKSICVFKEILMTWIKVLHVLLVFIWIGNLLTLSRIFGYHVKEERNVQERTVKWYRRIYFFVNIPCMILAVTFGLILLMQPQFRGQPLWFNVKIIFILGLIGCDLVVGKQIMYLQNNFKKFKGIRYKILHGVLGLLFLGVMISVYVIRDREGEMRAKVVAELSLEQQNELFFENSKS
jgi:uncharacterized membrane protein